MGKIWLRIKHCVYLMFRMRLYLIFPLDFWENSCFRSNDEFALKFANKLYRCYHPLYRGTVTKWTVLYQHESTFTPTHPQFSPLCIVLPRCSNYTPGLTAFRIESPRQIRQSIRVGSAYIYMYAPDISIRPTARDRKHWTSRSKTSMFFWYLVSSCSRVSLTPWSNAPRCRLNWPRKCISYVNKRLLFFFGISIFYFLYFSIT